MSSVTFYVLTPGDICFGDKTPLTKNSKAGSGPIPDSEYEFSCPGTHNLLGLKDLFLFKDQVNFHFSFK